GWRRASPRDDPSAPDRARRRSAHTRREAARTGAARAHALGDPDLAVVADHEPVRGRLAMRAADLHVLADQAGLDAAVDVGDGGAFQHDRVLDLAVLDRAAVA